MRGGRRTSDRSGGHGRGRGGRGGRGGQSGGKRQHIRAHYDSARGDSQNQNRSTGINGSHVNGSSHRGARPKNFLDKIRDQDVRLENSKKAELFFQKAMELSKQDCLLYLDTVPSSVLQESVQFVTPKDLNTCVLKLIETLGSPVIEHGVYPQMRVKVFQSIFDAAQFPEILRKAVELDKIPRISDVCWFLALLSTADAQVRMHKEVQRILAIVQHQYPKTARQLANVLNEVQPKGACSIDRVAVVPGGRHDNDFENFRDIQVLPSAAELMCQEESYLPFAPGNGDTVTEAELLDRQFRLYREDMVAPIREELVQECGMNAQKQRRTFKNPKLTGIKLGKRDAVFTVEVQLPPRILGRLRNKKSKMSYKEVQAFFNEGAGRKLFGRDSLVIFFDSRDGKKKQDSKESKVPHIKLIGTVRDRDDMVTPKQIEKPKEGDKNAGTKRYSDWNAPFSDNIVRIGVSFAASSMKSVLKFLPELGHKRNGFPISSEVFNSSTSYFTYEPILRVLQEMTEVPFSTELVENQPPQPSTVVSEGISTENLSSEIQGAIGTDSTQRQALQNTLDYRVSLVQGPPGTGKTYIGVQMVKALLEQNPSVRILCLCYTNHALDSFLESLLDANINESEFVRLGNQQKVSERLKSRCINNIPNTKFNREQNRSYSNLMREQDTCRENVDLLKNELNKSTWGTSMSWWNTIKCFLNDSYPVELQDLVTPTSRDVNGMTTVGKNNKEVQSNYLWERWCKGENRGIFEDGQHRLLWEKSGKAIRTQKKNDWNHEWLEPKLQAIAKNLADYQSSIQQIERLRASNNCTALRKHRIIGCTTVSAAQKRDLLKEVAPNVVMVEEAGEIFEAQILTNLSKSCEDLILIGDHMQLPPKAESYNLRKEARKGYDLDVSLFERLVTNTTVNVSSVMLHIQHRMRPEISRLIRETMYPDLEDAKSTKGRPDVKGVSKNIVFVDHRHPEVEDDEAAVLGSNSKINRHEAEMTAAMAKYFLKQGYAPEQITILTPYLGQLPQIREALESNQISSEINGLDHKDLQRFDFDISSNSVAESNATKVRVATVDNFQGEESDIVIVSMVRSNDNKEIGFVGNRERVNVLLSRAKLGMFLVGNMNVLSNAKSKRGQELWSKIKMLLEQKEQIIPYFPAYCAKHKKLLEIKCRKDFEELCPNGGCDLPCSEKLQCGHQCPMGCHLDDCDDTKCLQWVNDKCDLGHVVRRKCSKQLYCHTLVYDVCKNGHQIKRKCSSDDPEPCVQSFSFRCDFGHTIVGKCSSGRPRKCNMCADLNKQENSFQQAEEKRLKQLADLENELTEAQDKLDKARKKKDGEMKLDILRRELELTQAALSKQESDTLDDIVVCPPLTEMHTSAKKDKLRSKASSVPTSSVHSNGLSKALPSVSRASNTATEERVMQDTHAKSPPLDLEALLDILEESKGSCLKAHGRLNAAQERIDKSTFDCLNYILLDEMEEPVSPLPSEIQNGEVTTLSKVIIKYAFALMYRNQYPCIAADHAKQFKRANEALCPITRKAVPLQWFKQAERIITAPIQKPRKQIDKDNDLEQRWLGIKKNDKKAPTSIDKLMDMIGLKAVKEAFIEQYQLVKLAKEQGSPASSSYNVRFEGNPGTGKTTVARIFARFLQDLDVIPADEELIEFSAANLIKDGSKKLEEELEKLKENGGGCVFIDEAYQLKTNMKGEEVLDFILPLAESLETKYGKLVWIFAGYKAQMDKLFEHNVGLPSRFPLRFCFQDYEDKELLSIFKSCLQPPKESKTEAKTIQKQVLNSNPAQRIPSIGNGYASRGGYAYYGTSPGTTEVDRFGETWTFNGNSWKDSVGNTTTYPQQVGTSRSPLVDKDTQQWVYVEAPKQEWRNTSTGKTRKAVPGKLEPTPNSTQKEAFHCTENDAIIAVKRIGRRRGTAGFGNARAVRSFYDQIRARQAKRIQAERRMGNKPDIFELTREDLLGKKVTREYLKSCRAYKDLNNMEGLLPVKESVEQLIELVVKNSTRELKGLPLLDVVLNRVFLGNPGTGKTTVAKYYGGVLAHLGLLSKGDVILKCASDFVGDVVGSSETITNGILNTARGCVLVIDEAYSLGPAKGTSDPYRTAVIDTLVEKVQGKPGDDIAVVLIGYKEEMEDMMKRVNAGLKRRFQLENAFNFPDFSDISLLKILRKSCEDDGLTMSTAVAKRAIQSLSKARARPHFGNAGEVKNLLSKAKLKLQQRPGNPNDLTLSDFDIPDDPGPNELELERCFEGLIGCDAVRKEMEEIKNLIEENADGKEDIPMNYLFLGNPGTGKTTVARRMGRMFQALGVLASGEVLEVSASDMVTGYLGQSGHKTTEVMEKALGGVLFIDEAYQLDPQKGGSYMGEVVAELVKNLTSERFKGKMLVILAGYDKDMNSMLQTNPGLKSRFSERLHFENFDAKATEQLVRLTLQEKGHRLNELKEDRLSSLCKDLVESNEFGNGRDVETWFKKANKIRASRVKQSKALNGKKVFELCDFEDGLNELLGSRVVSDTSAACAPIPTLQQAVATSSFKSARPTTRTTAATAAATITEPNEDENEHTAQDPVSSNAFESISKQALESVQRFLDRKEMNSEQGAKDLASASMEDPKFEQMKKALVNELGWSPSTAHKTLIEWQNAHKSFQAELVKSKEAVKKTGVEPIWRCAVCGRADKPYIACYVAPYVVRYQKVNL